MRSDLNHIQEIENYLNGTMSTSERNNFEIKINGDSDLKEDVELQKALVDRLNFLAFKADVQLAHSALAPAHKVWWKKGMFLNSVLVLIGCAAIWILSKQFSDQPVSDNQSATFVNDDKPENLLATADLVDSDTLIPVAGDEVMVPMAEKKTTKKNQPHLAFQKRFEKVQLNATTGGTIVTKESKSSLHFDPKIIVDKNGKVVEGMVEIRYREYRNPADMAFSGIPMMYYENNQEFRFNSAGMIEVRAYQNNQELNVKPGEHFTMDFNVTQQVDSCYFFALDDETQEWEKKQRIDFDSINREYIKGPEFFDDEEKMPGKYRGMLQGNVKLFSLWEEVEENDDPPRIAVKLYYPMGYWNDQAPAYRAIVVNNTYQIESIDSGRYIVEIGCDECENLMIDTLVIYADKVSQLDASVSKFLTHPRMTRKRYFAIRRNKKWKKVLEDMWVPSTYELRDSVMPVNNWATSERKQELDSIYSAAATITSNAKTMLVSGLQAENFGVYNCDQIKLVEDDIHVRPHFVDGQGMAILGIYLLSMIDLNINAAFSFGPSGFKCERGGKNVVLAFTPEKLYAISAPEFQALNIRSSGKQTLKMTDITDQILTSEDLKKYLGIR